MLRDLRKKTIQALTRFWSTRRFIKDRDLIGWLRLRSAPPQTFSMVVAIYKVEEYLDDFVHSVLRQRGGLKHLEVIFVNDGSPDRSGEMAKAWADKRPDIFRYIEQENQGVAAARNAGLRIANGDWVGFPDPDDFFSRNYLLEARIAAMRGGEKLAAITANFVFFREAQGVFKNNHPLHYRFNHGRRMVPLNDMDGFIQLSGSHGWLRRQLIEDAGLSFDSKVMPSFEDAHFVNQFFLTVPDRAIAVIPGTNYYYRKRASEGSALDTSKYDKRWFSDELVFGMLHLLETARDRYGEVPVYIQRTVLYALVWKIRYLVNHAERAAFLSPSEIADFKTLLQQLFDFIDNETIAEFELAGCTEEHKVAMLGHYKSAARTPQRVYVKDLDTVKSLVQLSYLEAPGYERDITVRVNGQVVEPLFPSGRSMDFLGDVFFRERRFWIKAGPSDLIVAATAGAASTDLVAPGGKFTAPATRDTLFTRPAPRKGVKTSLRRMKSRVLGSIRTALIGKGSMVGNLRRRNELKALRRYAQSDAARQLYGDCWLMMDRADRADDNAEHLYRYLMKIGKADRAYFVLEGDSPDWARLSAEGFKLLPFRSRAHLAALINARFLISSHADHFILWPEERRHIGDLTDYRYVFLQHGVTTNDISDWMNKKPIRLFVTAMPMEYNGISDPNGQYLASEKEVALTGFARHDRLLELAAKPSIILIAPTWRKGLVAETAPGDYKRDKISEFSESLYARSWSGILNDRRLGAAAQEHGLEIVFCPHPNMMIYVPEFGLPAHVHVVEPAKEGGYQPLLAKSSVLVTDYSSVASETGVLDRPVVYYHFDEGEIFSGNHVYKKGPFDFRRDGFGPVTTEHDATVDAIIAAISGGEDPVFSERRKTAFPHRDGRCCERIYQAILALDDPEIRLPEAA